MWNERSEAPPGECAMPQTKGSKWWENKNTSPLALVQEKAARACEPAVCFRCKFFTGADRDPGGCEQRPGEPQTRFGICLSWEPPRPSGATKRLEPSTRTPEPSEASLKAPERSLGPRPKGDWIPE